MRVFEINEVNEMTMGMDRLISFHYNDTLFTKTEINYKTRELANEVI